MPTARDNLASSVVKKNIYAIGGYDGANYLATNETYNDNYAYIKGLPALKGWLASV
jgi:hypothetical protein